MDIIYFNDLPYNGIGRIICKFYDLKTRKHSEESGTAFIVAKNLIMTAAHVLKSKKQFFHQQLLRETRLSKHVLRSARVFFQ